MNESPSTPPSTDRRAFLTRCAKASVGVAATGLAGGLLWNRRQPGDFTRQEASWTVPDYSMPEAEAKMSIVTGTDRAAAVRRGLEAVGGIESFIRTGDRVLLKVNAAFATPAMLSATTHPDVVTEVARLCLAAGAESVVVTDNPINDPESCFALTGLGEAASRAGARTVLPKPSAFSRVTVPGGSLIVDWPTLVEPLRRADKVIGIAPLKHHNRSGASMTMKNWYGLIGGRRNQFHQNIHEVIAELATMVRPTLVILDATTTMMTNGPTGGSLADLKQTDTMIVSTDQVAADTFGATLLGLTQTDLPYLAKGQERGLGTTDYESLRPERVSLDM